MSTGNLAFGLEPNNVALFLYGYQTLFTTQASSYAFQSTAPQASLDQALANVRNGVTPPASPSANEQTLRQQAASALDSNRAALAQLVTWRTTGPGAGTTNLTSAQLSQAARQSGQNQEAMFKQLNGVLRLFLNQFDGTD